MSTDEFPTASFILAEPIELDELPAGAGHDVRMPDDATNDLPVSGRVVIPAAELSWRFSRSGGAGGQHVNTTDSRVELSWDLGASIALDAHQRSRARRALKTTLVDGVLTVAASDRRSQRQNRLLARERLAATIATAIAPPPAPRRPTKPSRRAQARRVDAKRRRSATKEMRRRPTE